MKKRKTNTSRLFDELRKNPDCLQHPKPDLVRCSACGKKFKVDKCPTEDEGDWETGYYPVPVCPKCEDGGEMIDYYYSFIQMLKYRWFEWKHK